MKNKFSKLSDVELKEKLKEISKLKELSSFNSSEARRRYESDVCFLEAEIIKRKNA